MRGGLMRLVRITFIVLLLVIFSIICSEQHIGVLLSLAESDNAEKTDKLGEDFQRQLPWFREKPESGESKGTPQPELYQRTPEGDKNGEKQKYPYCRYPDCPGQYTLCYNPDLDLYEYCYPADSFDFRMRFRSPKFRLWWEQERVCPPGYFFKSGTGCYPGFK